jgi:hypothetical protein
MDETRDQIIGEITALKSLLRDTDYEVTKYAEGLTACTTQAEIEAYREAFMAQYGEVIANRQAWRNKIRELEEVLDALDDEAAEDEPEPEDEDDEWPVTPEVSDSEGEPEDAPGEDAPAAEDDSED